MFLYYCYFKLISSISICNKASNHHYRIENCAKINYKQSNQFNTYFFLVFTKSLSNDIKLVFVRNNILMIFLMLQNIMHVPYYFQ